MLMLIGGSAWAGSMGASMSLGMEWMPGMEDVIAEDTVVRATVQWDLGGFTLGPMVQTAMHNATYYESQYTTLGYLLVPGDFSLIGVGPGASMPVLVETDWIRLGVHGDLLLEWFRSSMDLSYATAELLATPKISDNDVLVRPGAGVDLGFALTPGQSGPELFLGGDVAWRTKLGVSVMAYGGFRVIAGRP